jgi:hypothetical protein
MPKKDLDKILSTFSGLESDLVHNHIAIAESQKLLSTEGPITTKNTSSKDSSSNALENLLKTLVLKLNNNEVRSA